ncbi:MAG TPA: rRNA adenine dimethyltransferase family protein, partial [Verrucomicrobiae bacterium]|nr:rRNA adenine dimethyltransferase family protein [Verrucomicrobiae bacterium]
MAETKRANSGASKKPRLGQNFLADEGAAEEIIQALGDVSESVVLEIGPGKGALTQALARRAKRLIAVELDRMMAAELRYQYRLQPHVEIIEADVLKLDFRTVLNRTIGPLNDLRPLKPSRAHAVGNLPYYITSDILLRLFEFHDQFDVIVIMVQREVADRIAAGPGTRDYGLLSATSQLYTKVEK